jgi:hypothetical protein
MVIDIIAMSSKKLVEMREIVALTPINILVLRLLWSIEGRGILSYPKLSQTHGHCKKLQSCVRFSPLFIHIGIARCFKLLHFNTSVQGCLVTMVFCALLLKSEAENDELKMTRPIFAW